MALPVLYESAVSEAASASHTQPIPEGHQANDLLLAIVNQDGGTATIAASGWTQIGTQAAAQGQRTTAFWKLATSSSEADFSATGDNDDWNSTVVVIRAPNTSAPIHAQNRTDSANSTASFLDSGTVTTTEANVLLIYAWGFDNTRKLIPENPNHLTEISKSVGSATCLIVGYRNQISAGTSQVVRALSEVTNEGGTALVIAISDATPSTPQLAPRCTQTYSIFKRYAGTSTSGFARHDAPTWDPLSSISATTIDGVSFLDLTVAINDTTVSGSDPWSTFTEIAITGSAIDATGRWVGASHAVTSTNMTGKIFALEWSPSNPGAASIGTKGWVVIFQSSVGNWKAFRLSPRLGLTSQPYYNTIDLSNAVPYASGGTVDFSAITRVAYLYHRVGTNVGNFTIRLKNALLVEKSIFVDGCAALPVSQSFVQKALSDWGVGSLLSTRQGSGQVLVKHAISFGDGSRKTYVDVSSGSFELPLSKNSTIARRFWDVPADSDGATFSLKPGASDIVNFTSSVVATTTSQELLIDPASSSSASLNFSGQVITGWKVTNNVSGFVINQATFAGCRRITLNGGGLDSCLINKSIVSPAVITNNPGNITDCDFTSAGTGHAIEISATGTFTFYGNTFTGYGADTTTNAAIYNNSGGAVTLTIDGATPTVRNGAGASTTIAAPTPTLTISGIPAGGIFTIWDDEVSDDQDLGTALQTTNPTTGSNISYVGTAGNNVVFQFVPNTGDSANYQELNVAGVIPATSQTLNLSSNLELETNI
jgi:hypothetical protein